MVKHHYDHIFSIDHIGKDIMKLGENKPYILANTIEIILKADKLNLCKELSNQVMTYINNAPSTIRFNIFEHRLRSFNLFADHATRKLGDTFHL